MKKNNEDWFREFRAFLETEEVSPPRHLSETIFARVKAELQPALSRIFIKAFTIQAVVASLTLAICPQFGIGSVGGGHGLMAYFMGFGPQVCALLCGSTFLGLSSFFVPLMLKPSELRRAYSYGFAYVPVVTAIAFGALMLSGENTEIPWLLFWSAGGLGSGFVFLWLGSRLKLGILSPAV